MTLIILALLLWVASMFVPPRLAAWRWLMLAVACGLLALDACGDGDAAEGAAVPPMVLGYLDQLATRADTLRPSRAAALKELVRRIQLVLQRVEEWIDAGGPTVGIGPALVGLQRAAGGVTRAAKPEKEASKGRESKTTSSRAKTTSSRAKTSAPDEDAWAVLDDLAQRAAPVSLVWVPDFVRAMVKRGTPVRACWGWLHDQQRAHRLELRPEGGVGRLSPEDKELCPADLDGIPLSHVRKLDASDGTQHTESIEQFASRVLALTHMVPPWNPSSPKRFISHVWQSVGRGEDLPSFKARLALARKAGLIALSRADLPEAMDARDVRESELHDRGSRVHFIDPAETKELDKALDRFAQQVNEAALRTERGRWLSGKVFIAAVWEEMRERRQYFGSLEAFKQRVLQAFREAKLMLSRADLIDALPQDWVRRSLIDGQRQYHFVETEHLGGH